MRNNRKSNDLLIVCANDKGADQPAHPRRLISAFVVRCLDSMITKGLRML